MDPAIGQVLVLTARPLRVAEIEADELLSLRRDFIADIFDSRLTGIIVRNAFPASTMARVVEQLESGAYSKHEYKSKYWDGRVFGPGLYPTTSDLHEYFDEASKFQSVCAALFEGGPDFQTRIEELLTSSRAGQPVSVPRGPMGEAYATAVFRGLAPDIDVMVHCDIVQLRFPAAAHVASQCDASSVLSYLLTLAEPELGGELHSYGMTYDDEPAKVFAGMDRASEEARRKAASYGELVLRMAPGDLIVFNAGYYFHYVKRVSGSRTRWTQGGFLARSRDGTSLLRWH